MKWCLSLLLILLTGTASAAELHNAISLQGYSGILNTPNAMSTLEGSINLLYSNQEEYKWRNRTPRQENYLVSIGLFSFLEIAASLTDAPNASTKGRPVRDLSANAKFRLPFIPLDSWLPQVAFGMQDVGGGARNLETFYAVASKELGPLRLSAGYGTGPDRMKGLFGGAELFALSWLHLLGEYDTKETNLGVRIVTPELFNIPVNLQFIAKTSLDYRPGQFSLAAGMLFPLGFERHDAAKHATLQVTPTQQELSAAAAPPLPVSATDEFVAALYRVKQQLVAAGFENVRVGSSGRELVRVDYENSRYSHNELDAMGVVIGTVLRYVAAEQGELQVVVRKKDIPLLSLQAPFKVWRNFYADAGILAELRDSLRIGPASDEATITYVAERGNPSWLHSSLILSPGLKTMVGTEVGVFDYLLSLKSELITNLWQGGVINTRADFPFSWSENFDDGKSFRQQRRDAQLERLMLFQMVKMAPDLLLQVGGGLVLHDEYGDLAELSWQPGDGAHRFRVMQAYVDDRSNSTQKNSLLGAYRYYFAPQDTSLEGTAGRFYSQDVGLLLELKRLFGDTAVSLYYKNSSTRQQGNRQAVGIMFEFPLTLRQEMKPGPLQVRGSDEWSYSQEVALVKKGERGPIGNDTGIKPLAGVNLVRSYYNRDRLSELYIKKHLLRLRDAFYRYAELPLQLD